MRDDPRYPARLRERLGADAPPSVTALGNLDLLASPITALFCSVRCPGQVILDAFDRIAQLRDAGRTIISGFHTPVEKECLRILLRGSSPIIVCPARSLARFRVPALWKKPLGSGRMTLISPFGSRAPRITAELAEQRNEFIASLASEFLFLYVTPGGKLEKLVNKLQAAHRSTSQELTTSTP